MPRSKRIVNLPEVEAGSYNPDRKLIKNTLLLNQVAHFQKIERESMTEGQAAEYIQRITELLHPRTITAGEKQGE
jgi:hypothetical protein